LKPTAADKRSDPAKPAIERSDLVTGAVKRPAQSLIGKPSKVSRVEFSQMWQSDDSSSASSDSDSDDTTTPLPQLPIPPLKIKLGAVPSVCALTDHSVGESSDLEILNNPVDKKKNTTSKKEDRVQKSTPRIPDKEFRTPQVPEKEISAPQLPEMEVRTPELSKVVDHVEAVELSAGVGDGDVDGSSAGEGEGAYENGYVCFNCQPSTLLRDINCMMEHMDQQPSHEDIKPLWAYNQVRVCVRDLVSDPEFRARVMQLPKKRKREGEN